MKPRKILRRKEAMTRMGCGRTKFWADYEYHSAEDPFVPGTTIARVRALSLGPVNKGFLESDLDALIGALAEAGGHSESKSKNVKGARTSRVFLTDALPTKNARKRT
jgi:hypothetical protein